ncbi:MAG: C39 family peptidase [Thermodesulfovibrionales bacterium]|nr:C39 family peptidase [Thermodesulfovibrionales bacterium]
MSLRGAKSTKQSKKKAETARLLRFARNDRLVKAILFTMLLLHSCAVVSNGNIPESRQNRIISNVPFYAQEDYQCGPASLAGVMNYWKIDVTPDDIAKEIYSKSAKGTLNIDMVIYPQRKGLIAEQYSGGMKDLKKNIDSGYPLIVLVDYGFWAFQSNHFMVVVGYNEDGVIVNSGKDKGRFISEEDFIKTWEKTKFWTLLIKRK